MAKGRRRRSVPPGWQVLPNLFVAGCFEEASASLERFEGIKALGEPVLLFLGRLAHQKRWEDTIRAAEELQRLGVRAQWVFLGDGPQRSAFLNMLAASSARDRLHWLGSDPNPRPVLARASALVLTSLYEAWPTVILEAFDLGVPVVSYDCPSGPSEMLGNQERGWLTSENPKSLAAAVAELLSPGGTEEACRRTEAGRSFVDAHRPEKAMAAWLNYFDHVHAGRF
ncbi:MAG: glycosyltransferase [Thermoanaerobaculia bacterium]|nr:glycosyltransferase [Thermoanaerobaculia bacterium]